MKSARASKIEVTLYSQWFFELTTSLSKLDGQRIMVCFGINQSLVK